ncbi:MAG: hypothetical protein ACKO96_17445, partial [Flammeovirgaceae bacterium]
QRNSAVQARTLMYFTYRSMRLYTFMVSLKHVQTLSLNAKVSNSCNNYAVIRKYIKDPRLLFEAKKSPYYLIDSTYTVASDPNTMRDTGATRNALYFIRDDVDSYLDGKSTVSA